MKLRVSGSIFDYVDWNVEPFKPGKILWNPNHKEIKKIKKRYTKVKVRLPCRLDATVLDMSKLQPTNEENDFKAGMLAFAANLYSYAEVELTDKPDIILAYDCERRILTMHVALIMKKILGYDGGFKIKAYGHPYRHVGFGSSAILGEAVAHAINIALGNPIDNNLLIKIISHNYGEESETKNGYLVPGISTGGSGNATNKGGVVIVSSDCELVIRDELPKGTKIIAAIPNSDRAGKGPEKSEVDVKSLSWIRQVDRFAAAKICYWILMDFIPALKHHDLKTMGEIIYNIMLCGPKGIPIITHHGSADLLDIILNLKKKGVEIAFLSSAGPGLVAITKDKKEIAKNIFESHGCKIIELEPDNEGVKVLEAI